MENKYVATATTIPGMLLQWSSFIAPNQLKANTNASIITFLRRLSGGKCNKKYDITSSYDINTKWINKNATSESGYGIVSYRRDYFYQPRNDRYLQHVDKF